jgi:hypothetical protein
MIDGKQASCKAAPELLQCGAYCFSKGSSGKQRFYKVRDDFRIGLGDETVMVFLQPGFQFKIIFDDSIMDDNDLAGAVAVRMRIFFCRASMGCPTGMTDSIVSL